MSINAEVHKNLPLFGTLLAGGVSLLGPASPPYIAGDVNENFPSNFALLFFPVLARNPRMQGMATATKSPPF